MGGGAIAESTYTEGKLTRVRIQRCSPKRVMGMRVKVESWIETKVIIGNGHMSEPLTTELASLLIT